MAHGVVLSVSAAVFAREGGSACASRFGLWDQRAQTFTHESDSGLSAGSDLRRGRRPTGIRISIARWRRWSASAVVV